MEKKERICFIDVYAQDDDYDAVTHVNLEELEKEISSLLSSNEAISQCYIRVHSVYATKSTVEVKMISLEEDIDLLNQNDFADQLNDLLVQKMLTFFDLVLFYQPAMNENICYLHNEGEYLEK